MIEFLGSFVIIVLPLLAPIIVSGESRLDAGSVQLCSR